MWPQRILLAVTIGAGVAADPAVAQGPRPVGESGTVIVRLVVEPAGATGSFTFRGRPAGVTTAGGSLLGNGLRPGTYLSTLADPGLWFELVAITCDDQSSAKASEGDVAERTARFNVGEGETVTCLFTLASLAASGEPSRRVVAAAATNPFRSPDGLDAFPVPKDLPAAAGTYELPRPGPWRVTNNAGQMVCNGYTVPLPPTSEGGILEVLPEIRAVRGSGFGLTVPFAMTADPALTGRYTGATAAFQGRVAVTVYFVWQLVTDEWIIGYLRSPATVDACAMHQTFQLEYGGQ